MEQRSQLIIGLQQVEHLLVEFELSHLEVHGTIIGGHQEAHQVDSREEDGVVELGAGGIHHGLQLRTLFSQDVVLVHLDHEFVVDVEARGTLPNDARDVDERFVAVGHPMNEGQVGVGLEDLLQLLVLMQ